MKTLLFTITLLLIAGCQTVQPSAWIMGGTDSYQSQGLVRIGANRDLVELGVEATYLGTNTDNAEYGLYIIGNLPETQAGTPYLGFHTGLVGPIAGTKVKIAGLETVIEYQYLSNEEEEHKGFAGIRVKY
jgi:hypothetical protein